MSVHRRAGYDHGPTGAQEEAVPALPASADVDLVPDHHAHVVQPFERIAGERAAHGLGDHVAEHATHGHAPEDSVIARITVTRGRPPVRADRVVPAGPPRASGSAVLGRRGALVDGLEIVVG